MAKTFKLTISNVGGALFSGEALSVSVPGVSGDMQILAEHEPFISPLRAGMVVVVKENGESEDFAIQSGTLEVSSNIVTIIV